MVTLPGLAAAQAPPQPIPPPSPPTPPPPPPPPVVIEPPPPPAVEVLTDPPLPWRMPWTISADLGVGDGGMYGTLAPPPGFHPTRRAVFPLPSARLDGFVNPRITLGYDLAPLVPGTLAVTWDAFFAEGDDLLIGPPPPGHAFPTVDALLRSRADVNLVDLTYSAVLWSGVRNDGPGATLAVKVGGRLGGFYTDDRAEGYGYGQWVSNWFFGAGPLVGLRGELPFGLSIAGRRPVLFAGVDGGVLFGRDHQTFREADLFARRAYREACMCGDRSVPFLSAEAGVATRPGPDDRWRSRFGVRFTQFWGVGDLGPSRLDFQAVTAFIGVDWRF